MACAFEAEWQLGASSSGRGNAWFKVRQKDFSNVCTASLSHRIKLQVPDGVDYDIVIWTACGGTQARKTSGAAGVDESIEYTKDDPGLGDDSFNYWIEIRFNSGASCQEWSLTVEGRKNPC